MSFLAALPCLVATYALSGLYLSLGPSLALRLQGSHNLLFAALASPTGRGTLVAAIYIVCYLSVALPVVVAGILVTQRDEQIRC